MFHFRPSAEPLRIVGIDPGTDTLGAACLELDLYDETITLADARTFHGSRMLQTRQQMVTVYGSRFARLDALEEALVDYFQMAAPHAVCSESPFLNRRFPASYAALTECMTSIKRAVMRYDARLPLATIDPASAKAHLGVSGKSGDKSLVATAVRQLHLPNPNHVAMDDLDEHSFDAIAIAYYQVGRCLALMT